MNLYYSDATGLLPIIRSTGEARPAIKILDFTGTDYAIVILDGTSVIFNLDGAGTIKTGTWHGSAVGIAYGGTGTTNGATSPMFGFASNITANTLNYYLPNQAATSGGGAVGLGDEILLPHALTVSNLYVSCEAPGVAGMQSTMFTIYKNGIATALTCAVTGAATSANDTTHSVSFATGDTMSMGISTSLSSATLSGMWGIQCNG